MNGQLSEQLRLEREVMIHRFLYYVLSTPVISDFEYDIIEAEARKICLPDSPVHGVGSSLGSSYPAEIKRLAGERL